MNFLARIIVFSKIIVSYKKVFSVHQSLTLKIKCDTESASLIIYQYTDTAKYIRT
jgi:hypothetical protein